MLLRRGYLEYPEPRRWNQRVHSVGQSVRAIYCGLERPVVFDGLHPGRDICSLVRREWRTVFQIQENECIWRKSCTVQQADRVITIDRALRLDNDVASWPDRLLPNIERRKAPSLPHEVSTMRHPPLVFMTWCWT